MKAIRDLSRLRRALTRGIRIETRAITADNFDFRMPLEPVSRGSGRAIRQQLHHLTTLQIDDDRPESRALPPGPFIDAHDPDHGPVGLGCNAFLHTPQDRGIADWHAETGHQSFRRSPTRAVAKQLDDSGQPGRPAGERGCKPRKPLGKNPAVALLVPASPAGRLCLDNHRLALSRQVPQHPYIGTVT